MKRTDYAKIAPRYDDNEVRLRIPRDEFLSERFERTPGRPFGVLDLACGSGNYLAVQTQAFAEEKIQWSGLDASQDMLALARAKTSGVDLRLGRAEQLPFDAGQFDYLTVHFAFHHFDDKPAALDGMARVLKPAGAMRIVNIAPDRMTGWWVYRFFPEALHEDEKRFWSHGLIVHELSSRGFEPRARIEYDLYRIPLREVWADVERKDMSQFAILTDAQYAAGAARVREALERDPNGYVSTEIALVAISAVR